MSTLSTKPERPARTYRTGPVTRALRWVGVLAMVGITAWVLLAYPSLPGTVATHFNARGQADDWGPRWSLLVIAGIMVLLSLALAAISTRPRAFNYPAEVTPSNAQPMYREGERMMVWMLLGVQGIYAGIACSVLEVGGPPLLVAGLAVLVGALVLGLLRMVRAGR